MKKKKLENKITKTRKKLANTQAKLDKLVAAEAKKGASKAKKSAVVTSDQTSKPAAKRVPRKSSTGSPAKRIKKATAAKS